MIERSVYEIACMLEAELISDQPQTRICGISTDSRNISDKNLYIPLIGERADGHAFCQSAASNGAAALLWQKDHPLPETQLPVIVVENTEEALRRLAAAYLRQTGCKVIAITGSNGKTSCKDMFASVFSQKYKTYKTQGNHNNQIGLPITILDLDDDHEFVILEMGMEDFGEISLLTHIAPSVVQVITSIGSAHLVNLKSKQGIARAKLEILEGAKEHSLFLYNCQSPEIEEVIQEDGIVLPEHVVPFGQGSNLYVSAGPEYISNGMQFETSLTHTPFFLPAIGDFLCMNALPVIYAAKYYGIEEDEIARGLSAVEMTGMRSALRQKKNARILDDTYKSNPESAKAAIDTLMEIEADLHIAVLGDMLDLGEESEQLHYEVGQYAREKGVDLLFCTGERSRATCLGFGDGQYMESKEKIREVLESFLEKNAIILIKGSRAMAMDTLVSDLLAEDE